MRVRRTAWISHAQPRWQSLFRVADSGPYDGTEAPTFWMPLWTNMISDTHRAPQSNGALEESANFQLRPVGPEWNWTEAMERIM